MCGATVALCMHVVVYLRSDVQGVESGCGKEGRGHLPEQARLTKWRPIENSQSQSVFPRTQISFVLIHALIIELFAVNNILYGVTLQLTFYQSIL